MEGSEMGSKIQTVPTDSDVAEFLARLDDDQQRRNSETLVEIMQKISDKPPVMWGPAIIGFGSHHYKYASGREGDMPEIAFSPRKGKLTLYILDNAEKYPEIRKRLGKYTSSKACIYIKKLSDVDIKVLEELITAAYRDVDKRAW
jgi:hypothetical protein